jgi:preprotein translocase subunit SecG
MQILNIFHVLVAIALVAFVLIQKGQGATAGASFGAGASATVFGSRGASNFLTRATWVLAALFCAISLTMAVVVSRTIGLPETDLGVVAETPAAAEGVEEGSDVPVEPTLSVSSEVETGTDLPGLDSGSVEVNADVPAFEVPEDAEAIEGSEVSDEFLDDDPVPADSAEEGGAESGN